MTPEQIAAGLTWDDVFEPIDRVTKDMPPVERACSTCRHADIPPMPERPGKGWTATCKAPVPVNVGLHPTPVKMWFAAADAARWNSKRQKPCPAWSALQSTDASSERGV